MKKTKRVADQYWLKACEIEEERGGDSLKISKKLKEMVGVDGRQAYCDTVQEELDNLDLDYILSEKDVWGVTYLYWHGEEIGSVK